MSATRRRELLARIAEIERHLRELPPHAPTVDPGELHDRLRRLRRELRGLDAEGPPPATDRP